MTNAEWPPPNTKVKAEPVTVEPVSTEDLLALLEPVWVPSPVDDLKSKSPMKYAVDYKLVDEDGNIIEDTEYFIMKEFAWERIEELDKLAGLGQMTIRSL